MRLDVVVVVVLPCWEALVAFWALVCSVRRDLGFGDSYVSFVVVAAHDAAGPFSQQIHLQTFTPIKNAKESITVCDWHTSTTDRNATKIRYP